jgi:NTE family protein
LISKKNIKDLIQSPFIKGAVLPTLGLGKNGGFFFLVCLFICNNVFAQKVGVVLSGGGAGGACHVGVLKALEENNIPIDYITGTSVGALVGAMYASGYTPDEIGKIVSSEKYTQLLKGEMEKKYQYYYFKREDDASWITLKISFDSSLVTNIPTNFINAVPVDFSMAEFFTDQSSVSLGNFDSLFIPFRCVASDVELKKPVIFKSGPLNQAVRASMTYPFYFNPITVDGKILFDGGLYNNFPADVMTDHFKPDFIIGSVVTGLNPKLKEGDVYAQIRNMLVYNPDFSLHNTKGMIIRPWSEVGTFDFNSAKRLIDSGYVATLKQIDSLKMQITRTVLMEDVVKKRQAFKNRRSEKILIEDIDITGLNKRQQHYVKRLLSIGKKEMTLENLKPRYFRLTEDEKIKSVFPTLAFNPLTGKYKLNLNVTREKDMFVQMGGNISSNPISEGFASIQYNYLGKVATSLYGNGYFGRLNSSFSGRVRFDFPGKSPFYIEPNTTISRWDYYRSSNLFYSLQKPAYLTQRDRYAEVTFGHPAGNAAKIMYGGGIAQLSNIYYQTDVFTNKDTTDQTNFTFGQGNIEYEYNTLNRKLYASEGGYIDIRAKYVNGLETFTPGNKTIQKPDSNIFHQWFSFRAKVDYYLRPFKFFKIGLLGEAVYTTNPDKNLFANYTSSILSAPAFMPTPESKTLFLQNFRAYQYAAGGIKMIVHPIKQIDFRLEGYVFQPYQSIIKNDVDLTASLSSPFLYRYIVGMAALVYHTPVGPLSVSVNYYHGELQPFTFLFHFGYTIFNRKSID